MKTATSTKLFSVSQRFDIEVSKADEKLISPIQTEKPVTIQDLRSGDYLTLRWIRVTDGKFLKSGHEQQKLFGIFTLELVTRSNTLPKKAAPEIVVKTRTHITLPLGFDDLSALYSRLKDTSFNPELGNKVSKAKQKIHGNKVLTTDADRDALFARRIAVTFTRKEYNEVKKLLPLRYSSALRVKAAATKAA